MLYALNRKNDTEVHLGLGIKGRNEEAIEKNYQFRIASITKTFVSTIILQLKEEGKLKLEDKVSTYLSAADSIRYDDFHFFEDNSYAQDIDIEMLLQHRSGIADIFTDTQTRFNLSVLTHKKRQYTPAKVVDLYFKYKLNKKALFKPGEGYHYSDMNYMLLGFIIEEIEGMPLHEAYRKRIIDPLGMKDTYHEYLESPRGTLKKIDSYLNRINLTQKVNTSYEWAGGGLISTTKDLGIFIQAIFDLKLFKERATLGEMISLKKNQKFGKGAGMGIFHYGLNGLDFYGHGGFYGSLLVYNPKEELLLSINVGQANVPFDAEELIGKILEIMVAPISG
ncbi:MAG: serine hydrolase domain-containing protein [Bacteroidota bacterium]